MTTTIAEDMDGIMEMARVVFNILGAIMFKLFTITNERTINFIIFIES